MPWRTRAMYLAMRRTLLKSHQGGAREPQSGFPDGDGGEGRQAAASLCRVLQRFAEQIIHEDVDMEEIFKVFSQDGEWVFSALCGAEPRNASRLSRGHGSGGAVLRREEARGVHLEPGHHFY